MILLPIKPKYVEKILSGEKKVEFRKTSFSKNKDNLCLIYSSYPIKKIVGYFKYEIDIVKKGDVYNKYGNVGGIDEENLEKYYKNNDFCYVMIIKDLIKIEEINLQDILPGVKVPQSFCYLDEKYKMKVTF